MSKLVISSTTLKLTGEFAICFITRILGAGTFGQVWLVSRKSSLGEPKAYALKVQSKYELVEAGQARAVVYEKNIMAQLHRYVFLSAVDYTALTGPQELTNNPFVRVLVVTHSPFIIQLVTTYKDDQFVYMLMSLVQGGELYGLMHTSRRDGLPENRAQFYAAGVAEGLSYMHRRGYVYRDLKPENVLIDNEGYPVIVDFGFAKLVVDKTYTLCGTVSSSSRRRPLSFLASSSNRFASFPRSILLVKAVVFGPGSRPKPWS